MHKCMGQSACADCAVGAKYYPGSAQILIVIGKEFTMHVNTRSSNHDPNHVLDRDPKRLSEHDSSPCEHSRRCLHVQSSFNHTGYGLGLMQSQSADLN